MANRDERLVFTTDHPQVVTKESANLALLAGHQTGVLVRLLNLPGEEYKTGYGGHAIVPEGKVRIGVGKGSTVSETQEWANRRVALTEVIREIREEIQQAR